ncbi:MAG: hypothetical protein Fur0037_27980 [Planctomycetota bacterium]
MALAPTTAVVASPPRAPNIQTPSLSRVRFLDLLVLAIGQKGRALYRASGSGGVDSRASRLHNGSVRALAAVALLSILLAGGAWFAREARAGDRELPVYVTAAERMLEGQEIYRPGEDRKPFTYPPFFALPFVPLALLPEGARPWVWFAVDFAILLAILRFLHRRAGPACAGWKGASLHWIPVLLVAGRHVASVFENQSHDLLVAGVAVLVAASWERGRERAGALAGLGAAMKATPALFSVLFVLRRRWSALLLLIAAAIACSLLPDLLLPRRDGGSWAVAWAERNLGQVSVAGPTSGVWGAFSFLNQSLTGTLTRLLSSPDGPAPFVVPGVALADLSGAGLRVALALAMIAVLCALAWGIATPARDRPRATRALGEVGLVLCAMLLLSPQSSKSHFCVLLVPAAFCARELTEGRARFGAKALFWSSALLSAGTSKGIAGRELGNRLLAMGCVTASTVLLLATCVLLLRQPPARPSTNTTDAT